MSEWKLDRQISFGLLLALIVQTSGALLWAGRTAERIDQLEGRLEAQAGCPSGWRGSRSKPW